MKTIEEKAKAYDEALERAETLIAGETNTSDALFYLNDIKNIFPELIESEDEKIRKDIIQFVQSRLAGFPECERFVTWLEKQCKQKPKWTEDDDYNVQCCIAKVEMVIANDYPCRNQELIEWLKSIKQRMEE